MHTAKISLKAFQIRIVLNEGLSSKSFGYSYFSFKVALHPEKCYEFISDNQIGSLTSDMSVLKVSDLQFRAVPKTLFEKGKNDWRKPKQADIWERKLIIDVKFD